MIPLQIETALRGIETWDKADAIQRTAFSDELHSEPQSSYREIRIAWLFFNAGWKSGLYFHD